MKGIRLGLNQLKQDWRAGELTVLALALVIAVASLTSVSFFTSRIHSALESQASALLGGDLLLSSRDPISEERLQQLRGLDLEVANTISFPTMAIANDNSQLVSLKAVSTNYPLRGNHRISYELFAADQVVEGGPAVGTVWVGSRMLTALGIRVGETLYIGNRQLKVAAVLTSEPDQSGGMLFSLAPRLLMTIEDLESTGLLGPNSRIRYNLLLTGEDDVIQQLRKEWKDSLDNDERLRSVKDARPEIRTALARGESFLNLAALVSVLLAAAAVAMATQRYVKRHMDGCAIMRCIGAPQALITHIYLTKMMLLGLIASALGITLGYAAQWGLVALLGPLLGIDLPVAGIWPVLLGFFTGMIALVGFAIPPIMSLKDVPMLRVLRRDFGGIKVNVVSAYGAGILAFIALVLLQAQDIKLASAIVLGLALLLAALGVVAFVLLLLLKPIEQRSGRAWHLGLVNISRRKRSSLIQMTGFSIGLMALLLLAVVRTDLLDEWDGRLPIDTPNRFLINIQTDQIPAIESFFAQESLNTPQLYPMVRARLTEINEVGVIPEMFTTDRGKYLARRDFNLSWSEALPDDNEVVTGRWWSQDDLSDATKLNQISLEQGFAEELGLKVGDTMTFKIAEQNIIVTITNIRSLRWDTFRANFFVMVPPGLLEDTAATYISALYLPTEQHQVLNRLVQSFPNVTVLDVESIITQVRGIIERVTSAIEYVFLFTIAAGLMVMYAAIYSTRDERVHEAAIMRTLGARRSQLLSGIVMEYTGLGLLSGLVASMTAGAVGVVVAQRVFDLTYVPGPELWLSGMLIGAVGVGAAGTLGTRFVVNQSPLKTMRSI